MRQRHPCCATPGSARPWGSRRPQPAPAGCRLRCAGRSLASHAQLRSRALAQPRPPDKPLAPRERLPRGGAGPWQPVALLPLQSRFVCPARAVKPGGSGLRRAAAIARRAPRARESSLGSPCLGLALSRQACSPGQHSLTVEKKNARWASPCSAGFPLDYELANVAVIALSCANCESIVNSRATHAIAAWPSAARITTARGRRRRRPHERP